MFVFNCVCFGYCIVVSAFRCLIDLVCLHLVACLIVLLYICAFIDG